MNTGITFIVGSNTYHTYTDFNLRQLADITIGMPSPKTHVIDSVPGLDGPIDLTEAMGRLRYDNRQLSFVFESQDTNYDEWAVICSRVASAIHGHYAKVILDTDPGYYYEGRVSVDGIQKTELVSSEIRISVDAKPYKKQVNAASTNYTLRNETKQITIENPDIMPMRPVIETNGACTAWLQGSSDVIPVGVGETELDLEIDKGSAVLNVKTTLSSVSITIYRRGGRL